MSTSSTTIGQRPAQRTDHGRSAVISIPGLESQGLNSAAIISMESQPMVPLETQEAVSTSGARISATVENALSTVATAAMNTSGPGLFATTQTVTSSNPTLMSATVTSGAAIGGDTNHNRLNFRTRRSITKAEKARRQLGPDCPLSRRTPPR
jgi:flagellar capping protein FliD